MTTAAVLLAAGSGSRFGRPAKLLAELRGKPLIRWAVESVLVSELPGPYVVTGAVDLAGQLGDVGLVRVPNVRWEEGLASSLQTGIAAAKADGHHAVVIALADQPDISPQSWRAVAEATATPIAVATYGGRRAHPVRLGSEVWDRLPATGEEGARTLMRNQPELVTEVPCISGSAMDIDTAEELEKFNFPTHSA